MTQISDQYDPRLCARCHELGQGCCFLAPGGEEKIFGLTDAEVERISLASGLEPDEFTLRDTASPEVIKFLRRIHPVLARPMPGGRRCALKVNDDRACVFLTSQGCSLPVEARPYFCRIYPFWFTPSGRLLVLNNAYCLAQKNAWSWRFVLNRLGMKEDELRALFTQYQRLAEDHHRANAREGE